MPQPKGTPVLQGREDVSPTRNDLLAALDERMTELSSFLPIIDAELALDNPQISNGTQIFMEGAEARDFLLEIRKLCQDMNEVRTTLTKRFGN